MKVEQRGLIYRFAKHKVAANLLMVVMLLAGAWALTRLNTQFLPTFHVNYIQVKVYWRGASPADVAQSITRPLERVLRHIDGLKEMRSNTREGFAFILLEMKQGVNVSQALEQVRQQVESVRNLPSNSEKPIVEEIKHYEPIARVLVTGPAHLEELRHLVRRFEHQLLNRGIAKVTITGLPKLEISINVPVQRLHQLNMSLSQIGDLIRSRSQDIPAGSIGTKTQEQRLRSVEQQRTVRGFQRLPLRTDSDGHLLRLGDIATIKRIARENEVTVWYRDKPAVELQLFRNVNSGTLHSAKVLHDWLASVKPTLGTSVQLHVFDQTWTHVQDRINLLLKNGIGGLILIIVILYLFLNSGVAWWVMCGIPISFMASLAVLYFFGGSINMVSMFAIIMSLGIIVDDTIVVGEEALTQRQLGQSPLNASVIAGQKMLVPIMASSLTTVCAFLPLLMIGDITGTILRTIPLVVISVIIASLIECFLVLPGHLFHSFKRQKVSTHHLRQRIDEMFDRFREIHFRRFLNLALRYRYLSMTIIIAAVLFILGLLLSGRMDFIFFPNPPGQILHVDVTFSAGMPQAKRWHYMQELDRSFWQTSQQLSTNKHHPIGQLATIYFNKGQGFRGINNTISSMIVELSLPDRRQVTNEAFIRAWRKNIKYSPQVESLKIAAPRGGPPGADISVQLRGDNVKQLKQASNALVEALSLIPGVSNAEDNLPYGRNDLIFNLNHLGQALGLTTEELGRQIQAAYTGRLIQIFHERDEEIEVRVRLPETERRQVTALDNLLIRTPAGDMVPLSSVINMRQQPGLEIIRHTDTFLATRVTASVDSHINNANKIIASLKQSVLPQIANKYGVQFYFRGRSREQKQTFRDMRYGMILGLSLIYIILAWVFSSYGWPLLVMSVIPLGLAAGLFGHWLMGINITILSLFGFFGLSGIIINDAIILLNHYQALSSKYGASKLTIVDASCQRLRAVLLTSLTTVAGLLPLLFETSMQAKFLIPMAVSISFGLMFGTLLILVVIPILLSFYEDMKGWIEQR